MEQSLESQVAHTEREERRLHVRSGKKQKTSRMSQNKEVGASEHGLAVTETREDEAGSPKFQEKEVNECGLSSLLSSERQSG